MSARTVRLVVVVVCTGGVVGMIVSSALNHNGAALTFGLVTATAILCLMVATAVTTGPTAPASTSGRAPGGPPSATADASAARVEAAVAGLVALGADETTVRDLVREAVRLGRELERPP